PPSGPKSTCTLGWIAAACSTTWTTGVSIIRSTASSRKVRSRQHRASSASWADLLSTLNAIHLATLAGSISPGGHGLIVFDAASSRDTPALAELHDRSPEELDEFVEEVRASAGLDLRPEPK